MYFGLSIKFINMKKALLAIATFTLIFASCKKDDSNNGGGGGANEAILTTGSQQTVNLYALLQSCEVDNLFTFNTDHSVTIDEGPTKCSSSAPQVTTTGNWTLQNGGAKLNLTSPAINLTSDVLTMNSTTMIIRYVTTANGIQSTTTTTYTHL
jgi:hypothetical protein